MVRIGRPRRIIRVTPSPVTTPERREPEPTTQPSQEPRPQPEEPVRPGGDRQELGFASPTPAAGER